MSSDTTMASKTEMDARVQDLLGQILFEAPDENIDDSIAAIFHHLSGSAIYRGLDKVIQFSRAVLTSYAPDSVVLEVEEMAQRLDQLLDPPREASIPEYSEARADAAWDELATAFEEYQSFTSNQIDAYDTTATRNEFGTHCQEFLAQLAVSREAFVKLVHRHKA
jgi:c-di-GMP-related signal transduction protein